VIDPGPLMLKVAELVDDLNADYGDDATITNALIAVEVVEGDLVHVEHRALSASTAHAVGMAEICKASMLETGD
jgi:hypothetical protein